MTIKIYFLFFFLFFLVMYYIANDFFFFFELMIRHDTFVKLFNFTCAGMCGR